MRPLSRVFCAAVLLAGLGGCLLGSARPRADPQPIIDVHRHAAWPGSDDAAYLAEEISELDAHHIVLAMLHINEPSDLDDWVDAAPGRFIAGPMFPCAPFRPDGSKDCFRPDGGWPDPGWMDAAYASGRLGLMGEMLFVYYGIAPDDPRMDAYWELATQHDVPVAVHINRGPRAGAPPRHEGCCPDFDPDIGNPALLRPVLARYPGLRVYLQHAGIPASPMIDSVDYTDETLSLLQDFPNVFVDMSVLNSIFDEGTHNEALRRFVDAGFADRIMFGTDNMPAGPIIARINAVPFLTEAQRRGIFYGNAARFLRLDDATIARHHRD